MDPEKLEQPLDLGGFEAHADAEAASFIDRNIAVGTGSVDESRCRSFSAVPGDGEMIVQCERERGHGGTHTAMIDEPSDEDYIYKVSWWQRT